MGVKGLWGLLEPAAKPRRLETLANKRLAVDASIWIHQFLKAMRDKEGNALKGAHLIGFYRRIAKLLFYGVKPVFVFDGKAPALKQRTMKTRRQRNADAKKSLALTAQKILRKQLQLRAISEQSVGKSPTPIGSSIRGDALHDLPENVRYADENRSAEASGVEGGIEPVVRGHDPRLVTEDEMKRFIEDHRRDINLSAVNLDAEAFKALPVEKQHDIVTELKNRSRQTDHRRVAKMSRVAAVDPLAFSRMQIAGLVKRNELTERVHDLARNANVTTNPGLKKWRKKLKARPTRVAGERAREFVLIKNDENGGHTMALAAPKAAQPKMVNGVIDLVDEDSGASSESESEADNGIATSIHNSDEEEEFEDVPALPLVEESLHMNKDAYVSDDTPIADIMALFAENDPVDATHVGDYCEDDVPVDQIEQMFANPLMNSGESSSGSSRRTSGSHVDAASHQPPATSDEDRLPVDATADAICKDHIPTPVLSEDEDEDGDDCASRAASEATFYSMSTPHAPINITTSEILKFGQTPADVIQTYAQHLSPVVRAYYPTIQQTLQEAVTAWPMQHLDFKIRQIDRRYQKGTVKSEQVFAHGIVLKCLEGVRAWRRQQQGIDGEFPPSVPSTIALSTPPSQAPSGTCATGVASPLSSGFRSSLFAQTPSPASEDGGSSRVSLLKRQYRNANEHQRPARINEIFGFSDDEEQDVDEPQTQQDDRPVTLGPLPDTRSVLDRVGNILENIAQHSESEDDIDWEDVPVSNDCTPAVVVHEERGDNEALHGSHSIETAESHLVLLDAKPTGVSPMTPNNAFASVVRPLSGVDSTIRPADRRGESLEPLAEELTIFAASEAYDDGHGPSTPPPGGASVKRKRDFSPSDVEAVPAAKRRILPESTDILERPLLVPPTPISVIGDASTADPGSIDQRENQEFPPGGTAFSPQEPELDKPISPLKRKREETDDADEEKLNEVNKRAKAEFDTLQSLPLEMLSDTFVDSQTAKTAMLPSPAGDTTSPADGTVPFLDEHVDEATVASLPESDDAHVDTSVSASVGEEEVESNIDVPTDLQGEAEEFARFFSALSNRSAQEVTESLHMELISLNRDKRKAEASAADIETEMTREIQGLLKIFGVPFIEAPSEAESQCAQLVQSGLVDGIVTDDSDVFLFGGTKVLRNMFNQQKYIEEYNAQQIVEKMTLDRDKLIQLAYLLGSDYTEGIQGIGPTSAMEILDEWHGTGIEPLQKFAMWCHEMQSEVVDTPLPPRLRKIRNAIRKVSLPASFPDERVHQAYLCPNVDTDPRPFTWGKVDLNALRDFMESRVGWRQGQVDQVMLPLLREMEKNEKAGAQATLEQFFAPVERQPESKTVRRIIEGWKSGRARGRGRGQTRKKKR
ncbi:DNA repair protein rad2 [Gaertneriomyces sp. JEL0708]|nr:DNA repair protein rad2 [Gaertneriomyces sp. JEL0708]